MTKFRKLLSLVLLAATGLCAQVVSLKPVVAGTSAIGGTVQVLNGPTYRPGDTAMLLISGSAPNLPVVGSFAFKSGGLLPLGTTSAQGTLFAQVAADTAGSIDGAMLGTNLGLFGARVAKFTIDTPAPPAPAPAPSIQTLAQAVVDHRAVGAALVSMDDFMGLPGHPLPGIVYVQKNISGVETGLVNGFLALNDNASAVLAQLVGATVIKGLPPFPDPRSGSWLVTPAVNILQLPDGRKCNAGLLAQEVLINYLGVADLVAIINGMFI